MKTTEKQMRQLQTRMKSLTFAIFSKLVATNAALLFGFIVVVPLKSFSTMFANALRCLLK